MMKIVIHGTNGGYHIFTTEKEKCLMLDPILIKLVQLVSRHIQLIITIIVLFLQNKIIRDVVGDRRIGNVAFSIVIPHY